MKIIITDWKIKAKLEVALQLALNKLERENKIDIKKAKKIQEQINKLGKEIMVDFKTIKSGSDTKE